MMKSYQKSEEEQEYLKNYHISDYERPSIATDIAVFSILDEGKRDSVRKLQPKGLKVLLIKRASYPYKNYWAMPGGFCIPGEDVLETAKRELQEETNVRDAYLKLVGVYGESGRDPRGWIISNTFLALIDGEAYELRAGSDAWEARWFCVELASHVCNKRVAGGNVLLETDYELRFSNQDEDGIFFRTVIREYKTFHNHHGAVRYEIQESDGLAFDHGRILLEALLGLRRDVEQDWRLAFDLMPEKFTLTMLQQAYELIWDKKLLTANFRRKIAEYVVETNEILEGEGFRPAKLFERNLEKFD